MTIRKAKNNDLEGIKSLLLQVLTVHHNGRPDIFKGNCRKYTDQQILEIISNEKTPVLIAADDKDNVMGYAFCIFQQHIDSNIMTDIKTLYIDDLCVDVKTVNGVDSERQALLCVFLYLACRCGEYSHVHLVKFLDAFHYRDVLQFGRAILCSVAAHYADTFHIGSSLDGIERIFAYVAIAYDGHFYLFHIIVV